MNQFHREALAMVASVIASYRVEPHDEGTSIQEVVDHLTRSIGMMISVTWFNHMDTCGVDYCGSDCEYSQDVDEELFNMRACLGMELFRFDHEAYAQDPEGYLALLHSQE